MALEPLHRGTGLLPAEWEGQWEGEGRGWKAEMGREGGGAWSEEALDLDSLIGVAGGRGWGGGAAGGCGEGEQKDGQEILAGGGLTLHFLSGFVALVLLQSCK